MVSDNDLNWKHAIHALSCCPNAPRKEKLLWGNKQTPTVSNTVAMRNPNFLYGSAHGSSQQWTCWKWRCLCSPTVRSITTTTPSRSAPGCRRAGKTPARGTVEVRYSAGAERPAGSQSLRKVDQLLCLAISWQCIVEKLSPCKILQPWWAIFLNPIHNPFKQKQFRHEN